MNSPSQKGHQQSCQVIDCLSTVNQGGGPNTSIKSGKILQEEVGVNPKIGGKPPKWMVKIMENPIKMDDLGGNTPIFGNTQVARE